MTSTKCRRDIFRTDIREHIEFPQSDRLGRQIGILVDTMMVSFIELPEGGEPVSYYKHAPGVFFAVRAQATRNSIAYGATQSIEYFETEAKRAAYIAKRVDTARKAAQKKEA
jgi:hypothetical protein